MITETDRVARAIARAARRWPKESSSPGQLLLRLIAEGDRSIGEQENLTAQARRDAVERTSGALTTFYEKNYLSELREDWPA